MARRPEPFPDLDWAPERARELGDEAVALWEEWLRALPDLPVARPIPDTEVRRAVAIPVPEEPMDRWALSEHLRQIVLDYSMYPGHPGFMAYISGAGTVPGAAADLLAAAINQNVGGWRLSPAATEVEQQVVRWLG